MPVYNKRGILLLPKVIVLNPKDGLLCEMGKKKALTKNKLCKLQENTIDITENKVYNDYNNTCLSELN